MGSSPIIFHPPAQANGHNVQLFTGLLRRLAIDLLHRREPRTLPLSLVIFTGMLPLRWGQVRDRQQGRWDRVSTCSSPGLDKIAQVLYNGHCRHLISSDDW